jgi:anti-sigma regulatory factor (Ser/Thr protein kinase)
MSELTARFDLPLGLEAPAAARRVVRSVLASWGMHDERWLHEATVVISELVANAVRHGGGCLSLDLQAHDGDVTIGAADGSSVVPRRRDADDDGGRGLAIVEALVTRWGVHSHEGGKRVWAQLRRCPC